MSISIPENSTERTVTRAVLQELDHTYHSNYQHKFVDSVVKVCGKAEGVHHRKTALERRMNSENVNVSSVMLLTSNSARMPGSHF